MKFYVDFPCTELECPEGIEWKSENDLKEWVWEHRKAELLSGMKITKTQEESELKQTTRRLRLLDQIARVQTQYLESAAPQIVFGELLEGVLDLMESEYGFIGEVKFEADATMYLQTHAITNIAWNTATEKFYEDNVRSGFKFYNLNSLFGKVMVDKEPVMANDPKTHPSACGVPEGHPPLNYFLGLPFFNPSGEIIGIVGIANKPGGYREADIKFLEPFTVTCSNLIQAYQQVQENHRLIETLEEKVHDRTRELEQANEHVMRVSAAQLEHFACMSHEIRTPLNCIIGLASLLQRSELTPAQDESVRMIVTSGDLLLTVINDVLDYSKLESGKVEIDVKEKNLQDTLNTITHSIEMKARLKNLSIDRRYGINLPEMVKTDNRRLQQILFNLLGNAVKFSKEEGVIELHVTVCPRSTRQSRANATEYALESPEIIVDMKEKNETQQSEFPPEEQPPCSDKASEEAASSSSPFRRSSFASIEEKNGATKCPFRNAVSSVASTGSTTETSNPSSEEVAPSSALSENVLHFMVKDYGKGIEKDDFDQIFKPFSQLSAEPDQLYGGTGLGLAITTKLVHALGGEIFVDSQVGEWTSFSVDLPLLNEPADTRMYTEKLKDTTTILVEDKIETVNRIKDIFLEFKAKLVAFASMADLKGWIKSQGPLLQNVSCAFLITEDFYNSELYHDLLADCPSRAVLTYGPNFKGKKHHCHFRCLLDVFPSVLMQKICDCVEQSKYNKHGELQRKSSNISRVSFNTFRVLVAEDNTINQKVLCRILTRLGIENICVVDNGKKAVEKEASEQFDVVLMDIQMPVMDGIEACKLITNRKEGHPAAAVVFITAHVSSTFEEECLKAGATHYLPKPFTVGEIEKLFEKLRLIG